MMVTFVALSIDVERCPADSDPSGLSLSMLAHILWRQF